MPAGRPTKPTKLKELAGNPGKRPLNHEPEVIAGLPEKPRGMPIAASREWDRMCLDLSVIGLVSKVDGKALYAYCMAFADAELMDRTMRKEGYFIETHFLDREGEIVLGDRKKHPAYDMKYKALAAMKTFLIEFGLTPASRAKLHVEPPKAVDPMDEILKRKQAAPLAFDTGKIAPPVLPQEQAIADSDTGFDA